MGKKKRQTRFVRSQTEVKIMSELKNSLNRMKWDSIVIAVITIALGLVCILLPTESASVLTTVLGVFGICCRSTEKKNSTACGKLRRAVLLGKGNEKMAY